MMGMLVWVMGRVVRLFLFVFGGLSFRCSYFLGVYGWLEVFSSGKERKDPFSLLYSAKKCEKVCIDG